MKFCTACGMQGTDDGRFCNSCGKAVQAEAATANPVLELGQVTETAEKEALKLGNQIMLAFIWGLLVALKANNAAEWRNGPMVGLLGGLAFLALIAGVIYLLIIHIGIKKRKPGIVLGTAIVLSMLSALIWIGSVDDFPQYNFFDWMGELITVIQIALMFVIYTKIKPKPSA